MKTALKKRGLIVGRKIEARFSAGRCELRHDESKVLGLVKSGESVIVTEWQESVAEIRPIKEKTTQDLISTGTSALAKMNLIQRYGGLHQIQKG